MIKNNLGLATYFCIISLLFVFSNAKTGLGGEQDWGYVEVRRGAYMFYWLYYTIAEVNCYTDRPLVIWLQGGPGASSTGFGNFGEIGPLDVNLKARNFTWINNVNLLFIDNPVGSGFSYVKNLNLLTRNNDEITSDLLKFMEKFYRYHPEFRKVPVHIFSESYGGKMAAQFALELYKAKKTNEIQTNIKSVSLGNSWISPVDLVNSWAPLLLQMGIVDRDGYNDITYAARKVQDAVEEGEFEKATELWSKCQNVVLEKTESVSFYNILESAEKQMLRNYKNSNGSMLRKSYNYGAADMFSVSLENLMKNTVSKILNIPRHIIWGSQSEEVFLALSGDFMKSAVHIVEELLETTDLDVVVYSGQLDLICATPGTMKWIEDMNWSYQSEFLCSPRVSFAPKGIIEGFLKEAERFHVYWIMRGGHMAPSDNPNAMAYILKRVTQHG